MSIEGGGDSASGNGARSRRFALAVAGALAVAALAVLVVAVVGGDGESTETDGADLGSAVSAPTTTVVSEEPCPSPDPADPSCPAEPGLSAGDYRQTSTYAADDGTTFEIDLGISVGVADANGFADVSITQYFNDQVFQQTHGIQADGIIVTTKDSDGIYEVFAGVSLEGRLDLLVNINGPGEAFAQRPEAREFWRDINPRQGAAYDLFGDARTALKESLGRYVAKAPQVTVGEVPFDPPLGS